MTPHERYLSCMRFQTVDRPPLMEWVPWTSTVEMWMEETGMNREQVLSYTAECDQVCSTGVDFSMIPAFPEQIIAEDAETVTKTDRMGQVYREFKCSPDTSMPDFIDAPVKTRKDWEDIKLRLDPASAERYPADWTERLCSWKRDKPILNLYGGVASYYGGPSLFGFVRMLMGAERVLYAFYDEPDMVHDMMETATCFSIAIMEKALKEAPVTYVQFWEDMCFKGGPLISPAAVREFMLPRYKRITEAVRKAGVDIILLDSDGDVSSLIPIWLDGGINGVFPMEQAAGNDIHEYRRTYGKDLLITGGIDKRALAHSKAAIDRELETKIPLAFEGGYIPMLDHLIPPDVPFENFIYFWKKKKAMLGV